MIYDLFKAIWLIASFICTGRAIDHMFNQLPKFSRRGVMSNAGLREEGQGEEGSRTVKPCPTASQKKPLLKENSSRRQAKHIIETNSQIESKLS